MPDQTLEQLQKSRRWASFLESVANGLQINLVFFSDAGISYQTAECCPNCSRVFPALTKIPESGGNLQHDTVAAGGLEQDESVIIGLPDDLRAAVRVCSCSGDYPTLLQRATVAQKLICSFQTALLGEFSEGKSGVELSALRQINRMILSLLRGDSGAERRALDLVLSAIVIILEAQASWIEYSIENDTAPVSFFKGDYTRTNAQEESPFPEAAVEINLAGSTSNGVGFQGKLGVIKPKDRSQAELLLPIFGEECHLILEIENLFRLLKSQLTRVFGALENAVLLIDSRGAIIYGNPIAEQLLGWNPIENNGQTVLGCGFPWETHLKAQAESPVKGYRDRLMSDGGMKLIDWQLLPMREQSALNGWLVIAADRTEYYQWQEIGRRAEGFAAMTTVIGPLAHELRNPLSAIKAMLQLSSRKKDPEKISGYIELSLREIDRMTLLVNEFLHLGRAATHDFEAVDIFHLVNDLIPLFQSEAAASGSAVAAELEPVPQVLAAPKQLIQAILNIFRNAVEATGEGQSGRVSLRLRPEKDAVILEVEDNGPGLTPEAQNKLFKPFFSTKERGTGLGLAVVKAIINSQGGQISGMNSPNGGALFRISLPKLADDQMILRPIDVLIAIADETTRYPSEQVILAAGFTVMTLESSSSLAEKAQHYLPTIVLVDQIELSAGLDPLQRIWPLAKYIVFAESGSEGAESVAQIPKPPDYALLVEVVRKIIK